MSADYQTGVIKLSHSSVKQYLTSGSIQSHYVKQIRDFSFNEEASHSVISQICLAYLLQFNTLEPPDINLDMFFPLAHYAAENWITHANSSGKNKSQSSSLFTLMMKLFTDKNGAFENWVRICDKDGFGMRHLQKKSNVIAKPLYYASVTGLTEVSCALLEMRVDVNAQGGEYGNALQAASYGGHEGIAKLLIERGADVNSQGGE